MSAREVSQSDLQECLEAVEAGDSHLLLDDADLLPDIIKQAMRANSIKEELPQALTEAIKWGVDYHALYEELPGEERIQKRVEQLKAQLGAKP